jgi:methylmalonyl-CoA/ethylmalonyl-CoA epimerase
LEGIVNDTSAKLTGLAHISLAVSDAEAVAKQYGDLLGATIRRREVLEDRGLQVVFLEIAGVPIELVQPLASEDEENTVAKFIKKRGQGIHHVAFFVDDAQAALDNARRKGAELIDQAPRPGADGCRVAFLHPRSTAGALVEFVEAAK